TVHELMDPGSVGHLEGMVVRGAGEFLAARSFLIDAFPDFTLRVDEAIAHDADVVIRWVATGTHRGALVGIPPTGRPVSFRGISWFKLANGRIVEGWDSWNQGRLFTDLHHAAQDLAQRNGLQA
ncbi:MAG: ester cyclase, partial [Casimicrobiaceae bacterium]